MLKTQLLHPELLAALAVSGHFSQILVADANFPVASLRGPNAKVVHLNLTPGVVDAPTVLDVLLGAIPVQAAAVMLPPADFAPAIHELYRGRLGDEVRWERLERAAFYERISSPRTTLIVATAEARRFANLLLEVGVVKLPSENF
ncbi:MAG: RbsD/FucU family protein [Opitutaceae bacterium]|jgi:L-fucose mutarotase|nr:RbsD/FucU family protein [Opitutaceae bacterium]